MSAHQSAHRVHRRLQVLSEFSQPLQLPDRSRDVAWELAWVHVPLDAPACRVSDGWTD